MTVVIGLPRDERATGGHAPRRPARPFARRGRRGRAPCVPQPWPPGFGRIDAEYQEFLDRDAADALERARELLPADIHGRVRGRPGPVDARPACWRSPSGTGPGCWRSARRPRGCSAGSRSAAWPSGCCTRSPLPVALAPRGFRCPPGSRVTEVTAAYGATEGADELVVAVAGVAARVGAALRVASFAVRPRTPLTAGVGSRAEDSVLNVWGAEVEQAQQQVLAEVSRLPHLPATVPPVIGHGTDWAEALENIGWDDGSILAVGSSTAGPLERVFIGSRVQQDRPPFPGPGRRAAPKRHRTSLADLAETP